MVKKAFSITLKLDPFVGVKSPKESVVVNHHGKPLPTAGKGMVFNIAATPCSSLADATESLADELSNVNIECSEELLSIDLINEILSDKEKCKEIVEHVRIGRIYNTVKRSRDGKVSSLSILRHQLFGYADE